MRFLTFVCLQLSLRIGVSFCEARVIIRNIQISPKYNLGCSLKGKSISESNYSHINLGDTLAHFVCQPCPSLRSHTTTLFCEVNNCLHEWTILAVYGHRPETYVYFPSSCRKWYHELSGRFFLKGLPFVACWLAGSIHTAARMDAESSDHFWLTVVAVDGGMVPLSASVQVLKYYLYLLKL